MKVSPEQIEIPDECGDFCPHFRHYGYRFPTQYQGDDCFRCPVMNCQKEEDGFSILEPEEFRADLAKTYVEWWDAYWVSGR